PVEMFSSAGKVGPAYCTGVGKVMLAYLDEAILAPILEQQSYHRFTEHTLTDADALRTELRAIRQNGYGFDREEHEPGIICVALPILTAGGRALGAISVTSTVERNSLAGLEKLVPRIQETARAIAAVSRDWGFPDQHTSNRQVETN
ncbi:MAG: IclR family transcriptional regulator C-terminal domain-containing protein, partial [Boseongicola sp.]|nr:IclR family transcriptional regulator C-terminal domain-containing protein [Boseongicola sp.]